ncbi:MAG: Na+/H+ antiporter NhaC family protein [Termitinemataceae bacterium]|nr:MAG: Na+/H+ antiporter NhaC family protein [Termitinemataceae bacterium]
MELAENVIVAVNTGVFAFLPAIVAIISVFILQDVIASLVLGLGVGAFIHAVFYGTGPLDFLNVFFSTLSNSAVDNIILIISLLMLGSLVSVITMSGGHTAYGRWVERRIKTVQGVSVATLVLGVLLFIDDYFSCLLTGSVMGPITEKHKMAREKLAYFIDTTAGPVCVLAPLSSWTPTITQVVEDSGLKDGFGLFLKSIPYNFYAIFVILFAFYIAFTQKDFSKMYRSERLTALRSARKKIIYGQDNEIKEIQISRNGTVMDLLLPNVSVIAFTIFFICIGIDTALAINFAVLCSLFLCFFMYIPRRLMNVIDFFSQAIEGMKSMFLPCLILVLAWSLSSITVDTLGAGDVVDTLMRTADAKLNATFLPVIIFIMTAVIAFGLGSWGAFMMTIPFIVIITRDLDPALFPIFLGSTLAGAVFGDNASPITDTTTLASISASCNQMNHVKTQLPYAMLMFAGATASFIITGFVQNILAGYIVGIALVAVILVVIYKNQKFKEAS